jgi:hypothetical protein
MPNWGNLYRIDSFKQYEQNTEPTIVEAGSVWTAIIIDPYGKLYYGSRYTDSSVYTHNPYTGDLVRIARFNGESGKYVEELAIDSKGNFYALEGDVGLDQIPTHIIKLIPPHVLINGCDTGIVEWELDASGTTIAGLIQEECTPALNHDEFLLVANLAAQLKRDRIITGPEMGAIVGCAGQAEIP